MCGIAMRMGRQKAVIGNLIIILTNKLVKPQ